MIYEAMPYSFCIALQIMPLLQNLEKYGLPGSDLIKITFVYIFGMYVYFLLLGAGKYSCSISHGNLNLSLDAWIMLTCERFPSKFASASCNSMEFLCCFTNVTVISIMFCAL